ncbi:MAG TPA: transcription factor FapR [Pseudogracilibacillus sp.]|nr:transcription factor FapR [Pseudogracilibacillus sp.]
MKLKKHERQTLLKETIEQTPFITDEDLADKFNVSIQTIRLDRLALSIPELRERIKHMATGKWNETVKSLAVEEVIGDIIDLQLEERAISIMTIQEEQVFERNHIARGHHLFAQANSLAVALIDEEVALTKTANLSFERQVKLGEQVVAKAEVIGQDQHDNTEIIVKSYVSNELVFQGTFLMYRSNRKEEQAK